MCTNQKLNDRKTFGYHKQIKTLTTAAIVITSPTQLPSLSSLSGISGQLSVSFPKLEIVYDGRGNPTKESTSLYFTY